MKKFKLILAICLVLTLMVVFIACSPKGCKEADPQATPIDPVNSDTVTYDGDVLRWGEVAHAEAYTVTLDDNTEYFTVYEPQFNMTLSRDVKFSILAVANTREYCSAESSAVVSFKYIPMIESITVQKRTTDKLIGQNYQSNATSFDYFVFDAVEGAEYYNLYENGDTEPRRFQPEAGELVVKQPIGANFGAEGGMASLAVLPCAGDRAYSHISAVKTVKVLADPTSFNYDDDAHLISWRNIPGASYTEIKVGTDLDSIDKFETITGNFYVYNTSSKNFQMEVKAIGNLANDVLDSRLVGRNFRELPMVENLRVEYGNLRWNASSETNNYQVKLSVGLLDEIGDEYIQKIADTTIEGTTFPQVLEAYTKTIKENGIDKTVPCTYTAYVRPVISSVENGAEISYAAWSKSVFTLLETPVIRYDGNKAIDWQDIDGAVSYQVFVDYDNCTVDEFNGGTNLDTVSILKPNENIYNFGDHIKDNGAGVYRITLAALASDENSVSGAYSSPKSEPLFIVVLGKPTAFSVVDRDYDFEVGASQTEDGKAQGSNIYFNDVYGAKNYTASLYYFATYDDTNKDGLPDGDGDNTSDKTKLPLTIQDKSDDSRYTYCVNFNLDTINEQIKESNKNNGQNINTLDVGPNGRIDYIYLYAQSGYENGTSVKWDEDKREFVADKGSNIIIFNGEESAQVEITHLSQPKNAVVNFEKEQLEFDSVERASGYLVKVVCEDDADRSFIQKIYTTHYDLSFMSAGAYTISVKAAGNGNIYMDSIFGSEIQVIRLPEVTDLRVEYDKNTGATYFAWTPVEYTFNGNKYNPSGYTLYVGNKAESVEYNDKYDISTYRQYISSQGTSCKVIALGRKVDNDNSMPILSAKQSQSITVFKLEAPKAVTINGAALSFNMVDNATRYRIKNNDNSVDTTFSTTWFLSRQALNIYDYDRHQLSITVTAERGVTLDDNGNEVDIGYGNTKFSLVGDDKAKSFFIDSDESTPLVVTILNAPEVTVAKDKGTACWVPVEYADSYLVKVDELDANGNSINENNYFLDAIPNEDIYFNPSIRAAADTIVKISITAVGNNLDYIDSFPFIYTTKVEKLDNLNADADGKYFTIEYVDADDDGIVNSIKIHVTDADSQTPTKGRGYYVNIGGVDIFTEGTYEITSLYTGEYEIKVCAAGGNYAGEIINMSDRNTLYANSDYSATQSIFVLAAPEASAIEVSNNIDLDLTKRVVHFKAVDKAASYKLTYTYKKYKLPDQETGHVDDHVEFDVIDSGTIEFSVDSQLTNGYIKDGNVYFVIENIDGNVDFIDMVVVVEGDPDQNTVSNISSVKAYDVG